MWHEWALLLRETTLCRLRRWRVNIHFKWVVANHAPNRQRRRVDTAPQFIKSDKIWRKTASSKENLLRAVFSRSPASPPREKCVKREMKIMTTSKREEHEKGANVSNGKFTLAWLKSFSVRFIVTKFRHSNISCCRVNKKKYDRENLTIVGVVVHRKKQWNISAYIFTRSEEDWWKIENSNFSLGRNRSKVEQFKELFFLFALFSLTSASANRKIEIVNSVCSYRVVLSEARSSNIECCCDNEVLLRLRRYPNHRNPNWSWRKNFLSKVARACIFCCCAEAKKRKRERDSNWLCVEGGIWDRPTRSYVVSQLSSLRVRHSKHFTFRKRMNYTWVRRKTHSERESWGKLQSLEMLRILLPFLLSCNNELLFCLNTAYGKWRKPSEDPACK